MKNPYIRSKYTQDGVFALVLGNKASIIGKCVKDTPYMMISNKEIVYGSTLEDLKTLLTEREVKFNETPIRPIS